VIEPPQASPNGASEGTEAVAVETETLERRRRCITARTPIEAAPEAIWAVLTDYEALAEFIPNLSASNRLERPDGGIRLEQIGAQRALGLDIRARVVLDLEEDFPDQIRFALVEGDFQEFSGAWQLHPLAADPPQTELAYTVTVRPKRTLPVAAIARRLRQDLAANLEAVRQRVAERAAT